MFYLVSSTFILLFISIKLPPLTLFFLFECTFLINMIIFEILYRTSVFKTYLIKSCFNLNEQFFQEYTDFFFSNLYFRLQNNFIGDSMAAILCFFYYCEVKREYSVLLVRSLDHMSASRTENTAEYYTLLNDYFHENSFQYAPLYHIDKLLSSYFSEFLLLITNL